MMHKYGNFQIKPLYIFTYLYFQGRLCTSVKVESVQLALAILDGASIKPGETITFEVDKFELKNEYNTFATMLKMF